jgi:hypothetical protein
MKRIIALVTALLIGILGSHIGLLFIFKIASYFVPIEYSSISGSLFSNHIQIEKLHYQVSKKTNIQIQSLELNGINLFKRRINDISIATVKLPIDVYLLEQLQSKSNFEYSTISIDKLIITTHLLLKPIELNQVNILDNKISFQHQRKPYEVSLDKQNFDQSFLLKITAKNFLMSLLGEVDEDGIYLKSSEDSDFQNLHIRYYPEDTIFNLKINHDANNQVLKADIKLSPQASFINIEQMELKTLFQHTTLRATIDTTKMLCDVDGRINNSHIKTTLVGGDKIIISGYIDEIALITPYLEGDFDFNMTFSSNQFTLHASSKYLSLPLAKMTDAQITYDSSNKHYLNISAAQLRNPAVLIKYPSMTLQTTDETEKLTLIGLYQDRLEQVNAHFVRNDKNTEFIIDKFFVQNSLGERWILKSDPILISDDAILLPHGTLTQKEQAITWDGQYKPSTNSWKLNHAFNNFQLNFTTQGIIDADTEINIKEAVLNGEASIQSEKKKPLKVEGYYDLSKVTADLMNITPSFIFPMDYEISDSHIHWKNGKVHAELYSSQGDISISHDHKAHYISSHDISFAHHSNNMRGNVSLRYHDNTFSGSIELFEAKFLLNPDEAFEPFPKDIEIIGAVATAKPSSSNVSINLDISTNHAPVSLFGFEGLCNGKLLLHTSPTKPMLVTGELSLENPMLTLLNRSIKLKSLDVIYRQQPWLKGEMNLSIEKSVTVGSASANISNTDIQILAFGSIDSPTINVSSIPTPISQFEAFSYIFSSSNQLPSGNENYPLLEAISGLKRNQGVVILLQAMNQVSNLINVDITFRPEYNQKQSFSDDFIKADLTLSKEISEKIWFVMRHQLNEDIYIYALNYKINPWLSTELQSNKGNFSFSMFYRN